MADEQIIIEVVVDSSAAQKSLTANTKAVDELNQSNKDLRATNKDLSKDYKANSTAITQNNTQIAKNNVELTKYKQGQKAAAQQLKSTNNSLNAQKAALAANKQAIGDINTANKEGRVEYKRLEGLILSQTEALKEAEQAQGTFTRSVGDYGDRISEVSPKIGGFVSGIKSMTKSAIAFIATPLGAVLAIISATIALVTNAMNRNEGSSNKVKKAVSALTGIMNFLLKALEPLGEFLIDGIVKGFELAGEAANFATGLIADGLNALGFEDAAKSVQTFTAEINKAVEASGELADKEAELVKAQRISEKVMLDFQNQAELLRQVRDDESEDFAKRIKANNDLGAVLAKQFEEEGKIKQLALDTANLRIKLEGETVEALDARAEAQIGLSELEERITGQRSEQLVNLNSLERDRAAKNKEFADQKKAEDEAELDRLKLIEEARLTALEREKMAELELSIFRQEQSAKDIENAQEKADALISIDQQKTQALLDNDKLLESEKQLILEESLVRQGEIRQEANELDREREESIAASKEQIEADLVKGKTDIQSQGFALASELSKDNANAQKAISIAKAGINTFEGITAALTVPPPVGPILAGITGTLGAVQIAKIAGVQFKDGGINEFANGGLNVDYSKGGIGKGPSHKNGGIQMFSKGGRHTGEFQGGEAILTNKATEMFKPQLSAMNVAGGGKSFADGGVNLASSSTSAIDSAISGNKTLSNIINNDTPIEVAVTEINRGQSNLSVKQTRSTI